MKKRKMGAGSYLLLLFLSAASVLACVCFGSTSVPLAEAIKILTGSKEGVEAAHQTILMTVRLPRVLCVALVGAALSLSGCTMQGLLKNPLADGSTLGVSSGASLGAVLAIALGISFPSTVFPSTMLGAMVFASASLFLVLAVAHRLDRSLSTSTLILMGIVFSMFVSALMSLIMTFFPERLTSITFWTMGSLASSTYQNALALLAAVVILGGTMLLHTRELNAFAVGEDNAAHIGVNVKRTRVVLMAAASLLVGVCVSVGGCIGFVGLVTPHMMRLIVGPDHRRLLPASAFSGAIFLMWTDLLARTVCAPRELPIGVVTSLIGAVVFVVIFYRSRRRSR